MSELRVRPLAKLFGAEITNIDLSKPLGDTDFAAITEAFHRHSLLVFRDQEITPAEHVAVSKRFGPLEEHVQKQYQLPGHPEIFVVSNYVVDGREMGGKNCALIWHSDHAYHQLPSLGSLFHAVVVPDTGGDTLFATMYESYEGLSSTMKERLRGMQAVFDYAHLQRTLGRTLTPEQMAAVPPVRHPIARTHPATKRKSLFIGGDIISHVVSADGQAMGREIVDELLEFSTQERFTYRHHYSPNDLVFWDNRCLLHRSAEYDETVNTRIMHRTTVLGDRPF